MKKVVSLLLCAALLAGVFSGCKQTTNVPESQAPEAPDNQNISFESDYGLRAAVVYSGGEGWKDTLYLLEQAPMLGLTVAGVKAGEDLSDYELLYLDESLLENAPEGFFEAVEDHTRAGGGVFLPNGFVDRFSKEYLGISGIEKVTGCLVEPSYPECTGDEAALQQIVRDFSEVYQSYADYSVLKEKDYGWGVVADGATSLARWGELTVYALNHYGEGTVFLTNPLLPNAHSTGRLTMEIEDGDSAFASTTAAFDQLLLCGFAEYIAKQTYGYALERSYGYFGTPSMAWELHYEEITGIANGSLQIFSELSRQYQQIPSLTLIRNSYTWLDRTESVTYLLNQAESGHAYEMDFYESAYSSGTHIDVAGQWLSIVRQGAAGSYFADFPQHTNRAYPTVLDYNGDGLLDLFCGSQNGYIYYYEGLGYKNGRLHMAFPQYLYTPDGEILTYGLFSAPQLADVNGDGSLDLICGWSDGAIRWFSGDGSLDFHEEGILLQSDIEGQILPAVADVNEDGVFDLMAGSNSGILMIYYGNRDADGAVSFSHFDAASLSKVCANASMGSWLSPTAVDFNEDGRVDLAVGVFDGYVARLLAREDGSYSFDGYITIDEMNYKGNHNLKIGNWAVPVFVDLNGDGREDLMCGGQEYGLAYPIDCGYFPYEAQLREQVAFAEENDLYVGVHFYTNTYASAEREAYELQAHKKAFEYYGLNTEKIGVNQHTWYTSSLDPTQSMAGIYDAGLSWQSGFASSRSATNVPQAAAENVVSLPFYLMEEGARTTLMQNNATLLYGPEEWNTLSARYHMPVCVYYHCDLVYQSDAESLDALERVQAFRENYGYNFNREDQLMQASAAALHQNVSVQGELSEQTGLTIRPEAPTESYELYEKEIYDSLGVRLVLSEQVDTEEVRVDADIWYRDGSSFVLGLNRDVRVWIGEDEGSTPHIRRINMAADVAVTGNGAEVEFLSGGMMEISVEGDASTNSDGWTVTTRGNETIFTKYGGNERLNLMFREN